jgi:threonyl-tRNA synthetase
MLHRTILGSMERFFGVMVEHYAGAFPAWLAPEQIAILTVTDRQIEFANEVRRVLADKGFRVEMYLDNEKLGAKIRLARLKRIPAMAVIGDKEIEGRGVSLRSRADGELGFKTIDELVAWLEKEAAEPRVYEIG